MNHYMKYINDFLYFVFLPCDGNGSDAMLYCFGVNLDRFLPITRGRHRPLANPARRGIQLANHGVRALALEQGAVPKTIKSNACGEIVPKSDGWLRDNLLIENIHPSLPEKILRFVIPDLLQRIINSCQLHETIPDQFVSPEKLQLYLESLCDKYGDHTH